MPSLLTSTAVPPLSTAGHVGQNVLISGFNEGTFMYFTQTPIMRSNERPTLLMAVQINDVF